MSRMYTSPVPLKRAPTRAPPDTAADCWPMMLTGPPAGSVQSNPSTGPCTSTSRRLPLISARAASRVHAGWAMVPSGAAAVAGAHVDGLGLGGAAAVQMGQADAGAGAQLGGALGVAGAGHAHVGLADRLAAAAMHSAADVALHAGPHRAARRAGGGQHGAGLSRGRHAAGDALVAGAERLGGIAAVAGGGALHAGAARVRRTPGWGPCKCRRRPRRSPRSCWPRRSPCRSSCTGWPPGIPRRRRSIRSASCRRPSWRNCLALPGSPRTCSSRRSG